jgi:DNA-binding IclR family transcriptional regulator
VTGEREPVGRAIDVLVWLTTHPTPPWSVRHVARELETSPTTIHRIFVVFEGRGLLERDGIGGYLPGLELFRVCHSVAGELSPVRILRPHLEKLADACGETVILGAYDPRRGEMMYLDMVQSPHPIRYMLELNTWLPVHAGATGLAIFAALSNKERELFYQRGLSPLTDRTLVTKGELEAAVTKVRRDGYIWTHGQRQIGAVGIASPIFDAGGEVFGDVCVTIPEQRVDESTLDSLGADVLATAEAVSDEVRKLGYRRGWTDGATGSLAATISGG